MFPFPFSFIAPAVDIPVEQIANAEAMSFNGTDQYITFPNLTLSSNEYTISLWIYSDPGTNVGYFLTNGNTAGASTVGFKIDMALILEG